MNSFSLEREVFDSKCGLQKSCCMCAFPPENIEKGRNSEMSRYLFLLFAISFFVSCFSADAQNKQKKANPRKNHAKKVSFSHYVPPKNRDFLSVSIAKDEYIQKLIRARINAGENITNQAVVNAILSDVASELKVSKDKVLDNRSQEELAALARKSVQKDFPKSLEQLKRELTEQAAAIFVQYKLRSTVTIRYYRGSNVITVKGPFYAFNGRIVKIGSKIIPFYDVIPADKIRIDKKYSDAKRREYIDFRYNSYRDRRSDAIFKSLNRLRSEQETRNEDAGYICVLDKWYTPLQLAELYIRQAQLRVSSKPIGVNEKNEIFTFDQPNDKELFAKIKERRKQADQCQGIDSDQGYDHVFWGFTRGESRRTLQLRNFSVMATREYDYFATPNRQIRNIQLDYIDNKLSRVTAFYTRVSISDFEELKKRFLDRYGPDDYLKVNKKENPKDKLRSLIWTGKHTVAKFMLKYDKDEVASSVIFVKEKAGAYPKDKTMVVQDKKN